MAKTGKKELNKELLQNAPPPPVEAADDYLRLPETSTESVVENFENEAAPSSETDDVQMVKNRIESIKQMYDHTKIQAKEEDSASEDGAAKQQKNFDGDIIPVAVERRETNLVQISNKKLMNSHKIFGRLYKGKYTPIVFTPRHRSMLSARMTIPHACACIIVENGKALGVFKPGRYYRSGFYQVAYCVNTQYIPYHFNINECPTRDNVRITIQIDFLLHVTNAIKFMYEIGPENLEELLRATQSEAVRSLARTTFVEKAYDLRGIDSEDMLATLNDKLNPFGVNIDQVAISNVNLPLDIAQNLQNSTSYSSRTKEQLRYHELQLRIQQDEQDLILIKQQRNAQLNLYLKQSRKERSMIKQDIKDILNKGEAEIEKAKAELNDKVSKIEADNELAVKKIYADRDREVSTITTQAKIEIEKINAASEQYVAKVKAETELALSENRAQIVSLKGEGEKIGASILKAERDYNLEMGKISVINALADNKNSNVMISGDTQGGIMTQLLVAQKTADYIGVDLKKK